MVVDLCEGDEKGRKGTRASETRTERAVAWLWCCDVFPSREGEGEEGFGGDFGVGGSVGVVFDGRSWLCVTGPGSLLPLSSHGITACLQRASRTTMPSVAPSGGGARIRCSLPQIFLRRGTSTARTARSLELSVPSLSIQPHQPPITNASHPRSEGPPAATDDGPTINKDFPSFRVFRWRASFGRIGQSLLRLKHISLQMPAPYVSACRGRFMPAIPGTEMRNLVLHSIEAESIHHPGYYVDGRLTEGLGVPPGRV